MLEILKSNDNPRFFEIETTDEIDVLLFRITDGPFSGVVFYFTEINFLVYENPNNDMDIRDVKYEYNFRHIDEKREFSNEDLISLDDLVSDILTTVLSSHMEEEFKKYILEGNFKLAESQKISTYKPNKS